MKKYLIPGLVILVVIILWSFSKKSPFIDYKIEGKTYRLMTAKSTSEWTKGLMDYRSRKDLKGADGMIFIFPDSDYREFWNQNTYLDLDIYWISKDKVIGKDKLPSIEKSKDIVVVYSPDKADKVVELVR